jgi:hypothetical protein
MPVDVEILTVTRSYYARPIATSLLGPVIRFAYGADCMTRGRPGRLTADTSLTLALPVGAGQ